MSKYFPYWWKFSKRWKSDGPSIQGYCRNCEKVHTFYPGSYDMGHTDYPRVQMESGAWSYDVVNGEWRSNWTRGWYCFVPWRPGNRSVSSNCNKPFADKKTHDWYKGKVNHYTKECPCPDWIEQSEWDHMIDGRQP